MTWSRPGSQRRRRPSPSRGPAPVPLRLLTTVAVAVLVSAACATDPTNGAIAPDPAPDRSRAAVGIGPDDIVDVVPKDRIPALDDPGFVAVDDATWLAPQEPVVALEINGEARAYPLQIMTWHEIVNDEVGGVPVAVTFCPLCNSAVAYERPTIHGEVTTFGVSGKLVHSNLVMYDRATDSLWPQTTGVAVMGELRGQRLDRHLARIVAWERFGQMFPDAVVLSRATGFDRPYGDNPYPGYDDVDNPPFLFRGKVDGRLAAVERVLGVRIGGRRVAFPYLELERRAREGLSVVNDAVGDEPIVVVWSHGTRSALDASSIAGSRVVGAAAAFSRRLGDRVLTFTARGGRMVDAETNSTWNVFGRAIKGRVAPSRLSSVDSLDSFWFAWAAFFPDTVVWPDGR